MRWMLLTETYPPEINGVAMTLSHLAEGLAARGHQVLIIRPQQSSFDHCQPEPSNPAHRLVWGVPFPWYKGLKIGLPYAGQLGRNIRRFKPDVIHIATEGPLGLAGTLAAHAYRVPAVSSFHTNFFSYSRMYGLAFLRSMGMIYFRSLHNATLRTFVPAQTTMTQLRVMKYHNLAIMSRGVDTQLFNPSRRDNELRRSWGCGPDDTVMIYVGRLATEKNLPTMIKAYHRLLAREKSAKMVIVGDGPARSDLQRQYPEFIFTGKKVGEDLARHYASADIFAFASMTETYGNVIMEAMSSGVITLAYDYAAAREHILDGRNGFSAPFRNEKAFLDKFGTLLESRDRWSEIRLAARATANSLSWENVVANYEKEILGLEELCKAPR